MNQTVPTTETTPAGRPTRNRMQKAFLDASKFAHAVMQAEFGLPAKPAFRAMCNHCGLCCMASLCSAARAIEPEAEAPCHHLVLEDGKALCGLVIAEREQGKLPIVRVGLGIGTGCSMGDEHTTTEELDAFDAEVHRLNGPIMEEITAQAEREYRAKRAKSC